MEMPNLSKNSLLEAAPPASRLFQFYFCVMGVASLLGYNAIMSSLDYFQASFTQYNVYFYLPLPSTISLNLVAILMPVFARSLSFQTRVIGSAIGMIIFLILIPAVTQFMAPSNTGYYLILLLSFMWGVFGQLFNSSMIGFACLTRQQRYLVSYNFGSSTSGIFTIVVRIFSVLLYDSNLNDSTRMYFSVGGVFTLFAVCLHIYILRRTMLSKYLPALQSFEEPNEMLQSEAVSTENSYSENSYIQQQQNEVVTTSNHVDHLQLYGKMMLQLMPLPILMFLGSVFANMMYPGVALMESISSLSNTWSQIWLVFIHNIANAVGKYFSDFRKLYSLKIVAFLVLSRPLHFIVFIFNAIDQDAITFNNPVIIINILVFSLCCGFTDGAMFVLSQDSQVLSQIQRQHTGFVMALSMTVGIMAGIFLAIPFAHINE